MINSRQLVASDAKALREIRLETLAHYGNLFARSYEIKKQKPLAYWRELAKGSDKATYFGLFDGPRLVGINAGRVWEENPQLALGWGSFIKLGYRGKGYSVLPWEARRKWAVERGLNGIIFYMLKENHRGIEIVKSRGAKHVFDRPLSFDGGQSTMFMWYVAPLAVDKGTEQIMHHRSLALVGNNS